MKKASNLVNAKTLDVKDYREWVIPIDLNDYRGWVIPIDVKDYRGWFISIEVRYIYGITVTEQKGMTFDQDF